MTTTVATAALKALFESCESAGEYVVGYLEHMSSMLRALDTAAVCRLIGCLEESCDKGQQVFLIGNGGSAAVASHVAADLGPNTLAEGKEPFRVVSLNESIESLTAIANDSGYENVFAYQLRCHLCPGDLVIAFSVSGNSENIIRAVQTAKAMGAFTVGLTGFDGGRLKSACDLSIHFPSSRDEYGPVEELFACVGHIVTGYLTMRRGRNLHH